MRPSVIALTGVGLLAAFGTAISSRKTEPPAASGFVAPAESESREYRPAVEPRSWGVANYPRTLQSRPTTARGPITPPTENRDDPDAPRPPVASARSKPRPPRTSGTQTEFLSDSLFRQLDANRDGVLTGSEIPTEFRTAVNEYGILDADTFTNLFQAKVQQLRAAQVILPAWFTELDPQGTGRVSSSRWRDAGYTDTEFQLIDTDGDGFLTSREVQTHTARLAPVAAASTATSGNEKVSDPTGRGALKKEESTAVFAREPEPTEPATRADVLLAHYAAVASGAPSVRGMIVPRPAPATQSVPAKPQAAPTPTQAPPTPAAPPLATLPLPLTGEEYWVRRNIENQTALLTGAQPNVLFLGDSITDFLKNGAGKPLWDDLYAPLGALDFAIGGITTSHVLWQIETGQVAMAAPKVVVVLIGSNNLGGGQPPPDVAAGVEKIVSELGAQLPDTKVLLLGILPRGASATDGFRPKIAEVNRRIADLDDGDRVTYLDIGRGFLSPDGSISRAVMPDGAHPSYLGYQIYTLAAWETLTGLLEP